MLWLIAYPMFISKEFDEIMSGLITVFDIIERRSDVNLEQALH
jgi:hypothetical protein